ncbi:MAG: 50S ribosomal protein L33 [Dehalococcoidia bacterium]|nr:50S ribosomal protein L33 [Dehalococcoidia bacterium]
MAKKKGELRTIIHLACNQCQRRTYVTTKNKRNDPQRLELNKYCPYCRIHTLHREAR